MNLANMDREELIAMILYKDIELKKERESGVKVAVALGQMIETNELLKKRFTEVIIMGIESSNFLETFKTVFGKP